MSNLAANNRSHGVRRRRSTAIACVLMLLVQLVRPINAQSPDDLLPKYMNAKALRSIEKGLKYLSESQSDNGSWESHPDGATYPCAMTALAGMAFLANGNTTTRGPYADNVRRAVGFTMAQAGDSGLIADPRESGHSMYGHGFSLMFLSCVYGMETKAKAREEIGEVIKNAIKLTAQSQSRLGGWIYTPTSGGDEGSVTVTQMQGLRAAHNAGFKVPKSTIKSAIKYLEMCQTSEGGICYSYASRGGTRLPISAAAICCLYSAGEYESPLAAKCLTYVTAQFDKNGQAGRYSGHDFYCNLYASQAFYQAGDKQWEMYFPSTRDAYVKNQQKDGSWMGDGLGPTYGTAIALVILQLPYKYLPIYQR